MTDKITDKLITKLEDALTDLPLCMRGFSLSMRSLYATEAVGTDNQAAVKFRKLRDDTRNDAICYLNGLLPITTKFMSYLQSYFEYYIALSFDDWKDGLEDIIQETKNCSETAEALIKLHEKFMVPLKERQDQSKVVLASMSKLTKEYKEKVTQFLDTAETQRKWCFGLAFIPGINLISTPVLNELCKRNMADAVAQSQQAKIGEAAALIVNETLIPALAEFLNGLECAAGFLNVLHAELSSMANTGERGEDDPKNLHYKMMKNKADSIVSCCRGYFYVIPAVTSDFESIPKDGTTWNYVDIWLENTKKTIKNKVQDKKFVAKLISAIEWKKNSKD